jgi:glutamine amidotransferase
MIAIVDYGRGNLGSVRKALARVGGEVVITDDPVTVGRARAVVVPGDGAFADAMESLDRRGLSEPIRAHIVEGRPYLGICLGYQILFSESEEFGQTKGLDVFPGVVRRFRGADKVPHMGWNQVQHAGDLPILAGIPSGAYFYFIHSYYPEPARPADFAGATCEYGVTFPALLTRGRLVGTQFHPEKSQRWGLRLLDNFAALVQHGGAPSLRLPVPRRVGGVGGAGGDE